MDLGIVVPTAQNPADWTRVKSFLVNTLSQLDVGGPSSNVRVAVVTYRGKKSA
jgi:hypothetical protein